MRPTILSLSVHAGTEAKVDVTRYAYPKYETLEICIDSQSVTFFLCPAQVKEIRKQLGHRAKKAPGRAS